MSMNRVVLVGRLVKDPELKKTQNHVSVVSFTLAVNRRFQSENQAQEADFPNCVAWNKSADFLSQYGRKGNLVGIEGRIQTRNYDDSSGKRVYVTEVVCDSVQLLESRAVNESRSVAEYAEEAEEEEYLEDIEVADYVTMDDLPF